MTNFKTSILVPSLSLLLAGCSTMHTEAIRQTPAPSDAEPVLKLTPAMINAANIRTAVVSNHIFTKKIATTGEIKADDERVFHVNSLVIGKLHDDYVSLGQYVHEGQRLASIENLEVVKISGNYVHESHQKELEIKQSETRLKLAKANATRLQKLVDERIAAEKDLLQAQTTMALEQANLETAQHEQEHQRQEAKAMLEAYGADIDDIRDDKPLRFSPIRSPRSGFIIKKNITVGDVVNPADTLYVVSDLARVWLDVTLYDRDLQWVHEGARVVFRSDALPGGTVQGRVSYIKPLAQDSRTFVARAELPNPQMLLKPGMFGQVTIEQSGSESLPYLPPQAVQRVNEKTFVFQPQAEGDFRMVPVDVIESGDGFYVRSGLSSGARVVVDGAYYLRQQATASSAPEGSQ